MSDRTLFLGEVVHVFSRQEILSGSLPLTMDNKGREPVRFESLRKNLIEEGWKEDDFVDGRLVLTRHQFYWHNTGSGTVRQFFRTVTVPRSIAVAKGNVIEIETRNGIGYVRRTRYRNLEEGKCQYLKLDRGAFHEVMGTVMLVGPNGAASLFCPAVEKEGWAPHRYGYGVDWQKAPPP